jgi:hypothetical protein
VIRHAGLWLRRVLDLPGWLWLWDAAVVIGSGTVALSAGTVLVSLISGTTDHIVPGPATVVLTAAIAVLLAAHCLAFAGWRLSGPPGQRVRGQYGATDRTPLLTITSAALLVLGFGAGAWVSNNQFTGDLNAAGLMVMLAAPVLSAAQVWLLWSPRRCVASAGRRGCLVITALRALRSGSGVAGRAWARVSAPAADLGPGQLRPHLATVLPLTEFERGYAALADHARTGKVVFQV